MYEEGVLKKLKSGLVWDEDISIETYSGMARVGILRTDENNILDLDLYHKSSLSTVAENSKEWIALAIVFNIEAGYLFLDTKQSFKNVQESESVKEGIIRSLRLSKKSSKNIKSTEEVVRLSIFFLEELTTISLKEESQNMEKWTEIEGFPYDSKVLKSFLEF